LSTKEGKGFIEERALSGKFRRKERAEASPRGNQEKERGNSQRR